MGNVTFTLKSDNSVVAEVSDDLALAGILEKKILCEENLQKIDVTDVTDLDKQAEVEKIAMTFFEHIFNAGDNFKLANMVPQITTMLADLARVLPQHESELAKFSANFKDAKHDGDRVLELMGAFETWCKANKPE